MQDFSLMAMQLVEFRVREFQSYRDEATLDLQPQVTLVAGLNDVGKSALLRSMLVFQRDQPGARSGFRVSYRWRANGESIASLVQPVAGHPAQMAAVETFRGALAPIDFVTVEGEFSLGRQSGVDSGPNSMVTDSIRIAEADLIAQGGQGQLRWVQGPLATDPTRDFFTGELERHLVEAAKRLSYLAPARAATQKYGGRTSFRVETDLEFDGANLTNILATLTLDERDIVEAIEEFMATAFPTIRRVEARVTQQAPGTQAECEIHVLYSDRRRIPLRLCGSGIEQLLILSCGILSHAEPRAFLIDEPHAYLHPHAERALVNFIAGHPEHQYVIVTHSSSFLSSRPITECRLVTLEITGSVVRSVGTQGEILDELGIRASDVWLADAILWVEGPSEVAICDVILHCDPRISRRNVRVVAMPGPSRFGSTSRQTAQATFEFCRSIMAATAPVHIVTKFLFDADERTPDVVHGINEASGGAAAFLPVREIENFFLDADLLQVALERRAALIDVATAPTRNEVAEVLHRLVSSVNNKRLYRTAPAAADAARVVGSEVLREVYWDFLSAEYDKVGDGGALAQLAMDRVPDLLRPLTDQIAELLTL